MKLNMPTRNVLQIIEFINPFIEIAMKIIHFTLSPLIDQ